MNCFLLKTAAASYHSKVRPRVPSPIHPRRLRSVLPWWGSKHLGPAGLGLLRVPGAGAASPFPGSPCSFAVTRACVGQVAAGSLVRAWGFLQGTIGKQGHVTRCQSGPRGCGLPGVGVGVHSTQPPTELPDLLAPARPAGPEGGVLGWKLPGKPENNSPLSQAAAVP